MLLIKLQPSLLLTVPWMAHCSCAAELGAPASALSAVGLMQQPTQPAWPGAG